MITTFELDRKLKSYRSISTAECDSDIYHGTFICALSSLVTCHEVSSPLTRSIRCEPLTPTCTLATRLKCMCGLTKRKRKRSRQNSSPTYLHISPRSWQLEQPAKSSSNVSQALSHFQDDLTLGASNGFERVRGGEAGLESLFSLSLAERWCFRSPFYEEVM